MRCSENILSDSYRDEIEMKRGGNISGNSARAERSQCRGKSYVEARMCEEASKKLSEIGGAYLDEGGGGEKRYGELHRLFHEA